MGFFVLFMCIVLGLWGGGCVEAVAKVYRNFFLFSHHRIRLCAIWLQQHVDGFPMVAPEKHWNLYEKEKNILYIFQRIWPELNFQSFWLLSLSLCACVYVCVCVFTLISIYFNDLTFFCFINGCLFGVGNFFEAKHM